MKTRVPYSERCQEQVSDHNTRWPRYHRCERRAVVDGKWCKQHDPAAQDRRRAETEARWKAESVARRAASAERAERDRRAALFNDLVSALEEVKQACLFADDDDTIGVTCDPHIHDDLFGRICAILARAQKPTTEERT